MKTHLVYSAFLLLLMTSCGLTKTTSETISEITKKINSKDFAIVVNSAQPMKGRQIDLSPDSEIRIKNDSAFTYLPYFGEAYVAPLGTEGGIKFFEPMQNYTVSKNKRSNGWDINFKIKTDQENYEVYMTVFNNGSASFSITPSNRDAISYDGEVKK